MRERLGKLSFNSTGTGIFGRKTTMMQSASAARRLRILDFLRIGIFGIVDLTVVTYIYPRSLFLKYS
jgi:hypothetical protein